MSLTLSFSAASDVGLVRKNNEDMAVILGRTLRDDSLEGSVTLDSSLPVAAFAVADGMGGYEGGEVASEIVCRSFISAVKALSESATSDIIMQLKDWARMANRLVLSTAASTPGLDEMGTTFVATIFTASSLYILNVGDSRCYRLRGGVLKQLTDDHSMRALTGRPDVPSNLIYNFMGNIPKEFISDLKEMRPLPGDSYLLCSDGLSDLVEPDVIERDFFYPDRLIEAAKQAGGSDNITVVSISIPQE